MTNKAPDEREAITLLRGKMGPLLRSDDEARAMLFGLANNPAVQVFAVTLKERERLVTPSEQGEG